MTAYVIALDQLGYNLINEIKLFSQAIGQPTSSEVTYAIYKELMAQVIASYNPDPVTIGMNLALLPVWPTILYVEDQHAFFDAKREFAARVKLFALAVYEKIRHHVPEQHGTASSYLLETASASLFIVNVYLDSNFA